ncbi:MAG: YitT family protein [Oscillospiraceae bacterium]|jgi:uncharacterized membrane-anchored protein YitT (DUF2179 family)|nr:YitT family protein [Oscillospiraceae bacterium]
MDTAALKRPGLWDYPIVILGAFLYAASVVVLVSPNNIPLGGVTGVAVLLGNLFGWPSGLLVILFNIPLFLLSWRSLGRRFLILTLLATVSVSLMLDAFRPLVAQWRLVYDANPLLAALYGGVVSGLGLGLVFSRGATSGGSDILSKLLHNKFEHLSIGRINLVLNAVVIVISAVAYNSIEAALYALIIQYVSASVIDGILVGMDNASAAFIVTRQSAAVSEAILQNMRRGVTALSGTGMFSREPRATLLCAVRSHEVTVLKKTVMAADPEAFVILTNAREVLGKGFKSFGN